MVSRRRLLSGVAATALVAGAGYTTYRWFSGRDVRLSVAPPNVAGKLVLAERESLLTPRIDVPFKVILQVLEDAVPQSHSFSGNGPSFEKKISLLKFKVAKVSVGTHYNGTVSRSGNFALTGNGATLTVTMPVSIDGAGGLRGDVAKFAGLHAKRFRAGLVLKATVSFDLNPDWSPRVAVVTDLEWTSRPAVEIVHNVWIDVRKYVEGPMRKQLDKIASKLREAISADIVRREVLKTWRSHTITLGNSNAVPAYLHVTPLAIGFSGVHVADRQISFGVVLRARTAISTSAVAAGEPGPLPPLERVTAAPGRLKIVVPVRAEYSVLRAVLANELVGKSFTTSSGPKAAVQVKDVMVYPSGDRIAFGVAFVASLPNRLFDVTGRVFLSGKPVTDKGGAVVGFEGVEFSRRLDSPIWSAVSLLFEDRIRRILNEKARIDLSDEIDRRVASLKQKLAEPNATRGLTITVRDAKAGIEQIVPEATNLAALAMVDIGVDVAIRELPPVKMASLGGGRG